MSILTTIIKDVIIAFILLVISFFSYFLYINRDVESTSQMVTLGRYCSLLLNPNYTIKDNFNLGIDTYAINFLQNIPDLNKTCSQFNYFSQEFSNVISQRAYYIDKQIIQTIQNEKEGDFRQFLILGAGS